MTQREKIRDKITEIAIDGFLVILTFACAFAVRIGGFASENFPFAPFMRLAFLITPLFLLFFAWDGLYAFGEQSLGRKLRTIAFSCLAGAMIFVLVFFFQREIFFSRLIVLLIFLFATTFVWSFHAARLFWQKKQHRNGENITPVLIIGAGRAAERVIKSLLESGSEHRPVAVLAPHGTKKSDILGIKVVGKLDALEKIVREYGIKEIIQCDTAEQSLNMIAFSEGHFLNFKMAPEILGAFHRNIIAEEVAGRPFIAINLSPLFGWGQLFKRLFDLILSILILPFLGLIYLVRRPFGPVFSREVRARGFDDEFFMLRFAENGRFGHFLQKAFLRDLAAFWNVFKGEMSVVGPRPSFISEREKFPSHLRRRLILKPGITGSWQIEKLRGADDDFDLMIEKDIGYIHTWSFWSDLKILGQSVILVLKRFF